jgi:uncharacterized protein (DUF2062 family)
LPQEQTPAPEDLRGVEPLRSRLARRAGSALRLAWERARREPSSPREIALSVGLGVFSACTPFLGLHMWIAMGLATVFRLNRVWAFLGSRSTFMPIFAGVVFAEIEVAHRLRNGQWLPLVASEALARGSELLWDWAVGTVVVGGAIAVAATVVAYGFASAAARRPVPAAAPEPSSGFPPSEPQGRRP